MSHLVLHQGRVIDPSQGLDAVLEMGRRNWLTRNTLPAALVVTRLARAPATPLFAQLVFRSKKGQDD